MNNVEIFNGHIFEEVSYMCSLKSQLCSKKTGWMNFGIKKIYIFQFHFSIQGKLQYVMCVI